MPDIRHLFRELGPLAAMACLGAYALFEAQSMSVFGAIFPRLAGGALIAAAGALAVPVLLGGAEARAAEGGGLLRPAALLLTLALWAIALPVVGFVASSLIGAGLVLAITAHERPSHRALAAQLAALTALVFGVAFLFGDVLLIDLP